MLRKSNARSGVTFATSLAHFVNDVPHILLPAVLPVLIEEYNLNYAAAGAVIAVSSFLMTSSQAVTGYLADRWNRITLLLLGLTTLGVGTILIGFSTNYVQLLALGCLVGFGGSFFHPIGYSLLSDAFESGNRGRALGVGSAAGDVAVPAAFASSGFLVLFLGWRKLFMLWGLVAVAVAGTLPLIIREPRKKSFQLNARDNSVTIVRTLVPVFVAMSLAAASYTTTSSFTTTYLTDVFELNIKSANLILALMMTVGTVGSVVGGTLVDKLGEKTMATAEMTMLGVLSALSVYTSNVSLLSVMLCMMGFFLLGVWPSFYSVIAGATSSGARAFMYGVFFAVTWSFGSFFPYISGAIADVFGLQTIYLLVAVLSLGAAFTVYLSFKRGRMENN